jgi:hypothetical protein
MAWPGQLSSLITLPILSAVLAGKPAVQQWRSLSASTKNAHVCITFD